MSGGAGGGLKARMQFQEGIVFVVGGGGYVEYTNLLEWAQRYGGVGGTSTPSNTAAGPARDRDVNPGQGKKITYGATEIMTPGAFLSVLSQLGQNV